MNCVIDHPPRETDTISEEERQFRKSAPINALCNSYGWTAVKACLDSGVTCHKAIHRLIQAVRHGVQKDSGDVLVLRTTNPTKCMVRASMEALQPGTYNLSKETKHEIRLRAALEAEKTKRS